MSAKSCQECGCTIRQTGTTTKTDHARYMITVKDGDTKYTAGPFCGYCYEKVICRFHMSVYKDPKKWKVVEQNIPWNGNWYDKNEEETKCPE